MAGDSDPVKLTPDVFESFLQELTHEAFVAFVADLYDRGGWETDWQENVITAADPDRESERFLVWTDTRNRLDRARGREPSGPDQEGMDVVVSRTQDADVASTIAEELGATYLDTDDLHERLLYAIDRETCQALCREHFDCKVDPQPPPDTNAAGAEGSADGSSARGWGLIFIIALLGVGIVVGAGLPGVVTPPESGINSPITPGEGTDNGELTPDTTDSPTPSPETPLTPTTPTPSPLPKNCTDCRDPLSLDLKTAPNIPSEPDIVAGESTRIEGTATNWLPVPLTDPTPEVVVDSVLFKTPDGWNMTRVEPDDSGPIVVDPPYRNFAWELRVPEVAEGGMYNLTVITTYHTENVTQTDEATSDRRVRVKQTFSVRVKPANCYEPCDLLRDERFAVTNVTDTIDGTLYNPYPYPLTDSEANIHFGDNVTVNAVNGSSFEKLSPGESQQIRWNVTLRGEKARILNRSKTSPGPAVYSLVAGGNVMYTRQDQEQMTVVVGQTR